MMKPLIDKSQVISWANPNSSKRRTGGNRASRNKRRRTKSVSFVARRDLENLKSKIRLKYQQTWREAMAGISANLCIFVAADEWCAVNSVLRAFQ